MQINEILKRALDKRGSDLHVRVPSPPVIRVDGKLVVQDDIPPVTAEEAEQMLAAILTPEQAKTFQEERELDFAYDVPGLARFRANVLLQRGTVSIAFRVVPSKVPAIDELGLPHILKELILRPRGLILVTGPTGSGKSTTLAAMINHLNENCKRNVITIEQPVEFVHQNIKCLIAQRDVGTDTASFNTALVHALRHDPDVLVVGEMRDLQTVATAVTAAETGHLVLGTLHTYDAPQSIDRMIDIFPPDQQQQIRVQLAQTIEAVLSQTLVPRIGGGRIAAFEIMIATPAIRNLIRDRKTHQLLSSIQIGSKDGMKTLDQALADLVKGGIIAKNDALLKIAYPENFEQRLEINRA